MKTRNDQIGRLAGKLNYTQNKLHRSKVLLERSKIVPTIGLELAGIGAADQKFRRNCSSSARLPQTMTDSETGRVQLLERRRSRWGRCAGVADDCRRRSIDRWSAAFRLWPKRFFFFFLKKKRGGLCRVSAEEWDKIWDFTE